MSDLDNLTARVSRARRWTVPGGLIGLAVGAVLILGLHEDTDSPADAILLASIALTLGAFTATLTHLIAGGRLQKLINNAAGYDLEAERIKAAVQGQPVELTPMQQERAARYAATSAIALPALALRWNLLFGGVLLIQAARILNTATRINATTSLITAAGVALVAALIGIFLIPQRLRAIKQARAYSRNHPLQPHTPHRKQ